MDWDMDDETLARLHGERITVTLTVELTPGTYAYLGADDEVLAIGALYEEEFEDEGDTNPDGKTIIGPLLVPREPARKR